MASTVLLPEDFSNYLSVENAALRFKEAAEVAEKITAKGVELYPNLDHAAIFTDPPYLVAGPLKQLGYVSGWDARCYPSPVDGCDYINVSARLPGENSARDRGWFDYVAVVHPVDEPALKHMLSQGYGIRLSITSRGGLCRRDGRARTTLCMRAALCRSWLRRASSSAR